MHCSEVVTKFEFQLQLSFCRYLSYITVTDVRAGGVQSYLPLHRWLIATNSGGQQMVLLPPRNNSME